MSIRYKDQIVANVSSNSSGTPVGSSIPYGLIAMWSGTTVPEGWTLCNGENGTPDLRGRFILGSSDEHVVGNTGGEAEVILIEAQNNNMPPYYVLAFIMYINQSVSTPTGSVESLSTDDITNIMEEKNNG